MHRQAIQIGMTGTDAYTLRSNLSLPSIPMETVNKFNVKYMPAYVCYDMLALVGKFSALAFPKNTLYMSIDTQYMHVRSQHTQPLIKHNLFFINCINPKKILFMMSTFPCGELSISNAKSVR